MMVEEDEAHAATEATLLAYWATDLEDSEDDKDFTPTFPAPRASHDHEAEPLEAATTRDTSPLAPPTVTTAKVTFPDRLAQILQNFTHR